jgi:hypothetical protein
MATISMDHFVHKPLSANIDWPIWKQRLQFFFTINRIGYIVVTANLGADPPIVGETTSVAHGYLMVLGGQRYSKSTMRKRAQSTMFNWSR